MATLPVIFGALADAPQIVSGVAQLILAMEALFGKGNGAAKKAAVMGALNSAVVTYDGVAVRRPGKLPLIQTAPVQKAVGDMIDNVVSVFNSVAAAKTAQ